MSVEHLDQNNKLIGTKQIVPAKQSKISALRFCFKTQRNNAPTLCGFAGTIRFVPYNIVWNKLFNLKLVEWNIKTEKILTGSCKLKY